MTGGDVLSSSVISLPRKLEWVETISVRCPLRLLAVDGNCDFLHVGMSIALAPTTADRQSSPPARSEVECAERLEERKMKLHSRRIRSAYGWTGKIWQNSLNTAAFWTHSVLVRVATTRSPMQWWLELPCRATPCSVLRRATGRHPPLDLGDAREWSGRRSGGFRSRASC